LVVFLLFLGGWAYIAYYAITHGDLTPRDSFKRKCGQDSGVLDKKNLYYFDLSECFDPMVPQIGCPTPQVNHFLCNNNITRYNKILFISCDFLNTQNRCVWTPVPTRHLSGTIWRTSSASRICIVASYAEQRKLRRNYALKKTLL